MNRFARKLKTRRFIETIYAFKDLDQEWIELKAKRRAHLYVYNGGPVFISNKYKYDGWGIPDNPVVDFSQYDEFVWRYARIYLTSLGISFKAYESKGIYHIEILKKRNATQLTLFS